MTSDDGWHTVGEKTPKQRQAPQGRNNQQRRGGNNQGGRGNTGAGRQQQQQQRGGARQQQQQQRAPQSYAALASTQPAKPRNVVARQPKREQPADGAQSSSYSHDVSAPSRGRSDSQPQQPYFHKKETKPRKSLQEYEWNDLKQLRRIVAHLESIANYSKGGIIGSLRGKTIHNSEDREQDLTPISEIKINAQEDAFMRYIADFVDVKSKRDPDMDTLLGFMTILLTCIAHTRYYNQEELVDNYWTYHEKFSYNVWKKSSIPTTLHESILRELQEKLQSKPLAIDKDQLQLLLTGKEFEFRYSGNLSVPFCLNAIKDYVNCNQSKTVSQRRRLYRYEHRSGVGRSSASSSTERKEWHNVAYASKDYRTQVETFEKLHMNIEGAPVLGISSIDTVLHSIYTTFLKIRKRETPQDLLDRLRKLLVALPNLIDLPELLQQLNPAQNWCGYKNIESYPDLSDYQELKKNLEALLEKEGVKKRTQSDPIRETLEAIYEYNHSEELKTAAYKKALNAGELDEENKGEKGYPLSPKLLKAILRQLQLTEEDLTKYDEQLKKLSKLAGLNGVMSSLRKSISNEGKHEDTDDDEEEETDDFRSRFDEMAQMQMS